MGYFSGSAPLQGFNQSMIPSQEEKIRRLTQAWNKGDITVGNQISKSQAEKLAALAYQQGEDFKVPSKAGKKFAFNLANTATFGLLPDSIFKPDPSIGEMYHGEATGDWAAGGLGSLIGLGVGGYGLLKGGSALAKGGLGMAKTGLGAAGQGISGGISGMAAKLASLPPKVRAEFIKRYYHLKGGGGMGSTSGSSLFDLASRPGGGFTGSPLGL